MSVADDPERKRFDELCQDIWTAMLVLVSYELFCILALLQPDEMTLKDAGTVEMPFAQVAVNFATFEVVGPFVLLVILIYLHFLLSEWHTFKGREWCDVASTRGTGQRYLFNVSSPLTLKGLTWVKPARFVSFLTFYGSGPIVFTWFVVKIRAWPCLWPWEVIPCAGTAFILYMLACRYPISGSRRRKTGIYAAWVVAALGIFLVISLPHFLADHFPVNLENADLSGQDLTRYWLRNVKASGANLKGADLSWRSLKQADFSYAHLEGADFTGANLEGADFNHAHLAGADFPRAYLRKANFNHAALADADLSRSNLVKADFTRARMEGVDWEKALLTDLRFLRTILSEAKNLKQDQLTGLCGDSTTIKSLPSELKLASCP